MKTFEKEKLDKVFDWATITFYDRIRNTVKDAAEFIEDADRNEQMEEFNGFNPGPKTRSFAFWNRVVEEAEICI